MEKVSAYIPARGGSVRVPNKNLEILCGYSLVARKVLQLKEAGIEDVFVGSDSQEILHEADKHGAIPILRDEIACDESRSSANTMIQDFLRRAKSQHVLWAHCTNPFIGPGVYSAAIERYFEKLFEGFDSLISVTKIRSHMWNQHGFPVNYNPYAIEHTLAKELDCVYFQDGGFFVQPYDYALKNSYFFGNRPYLYEVDPIIGFDINTVEELEMAKRLCSCLD